MSKELITFIVLVIVGIVLGYTTSRSSKQRESLHGGAAAEFFHFLNAGLVAMIAPTMLTCIFVLRLHLTELLIIAVSLFGLGLISSILHAVFEKPAIALALANAEDAGWTEEDARTSGL